MEISSNEALNLEVRQLFNSLFGEPPSLKLVATYLRAHDEMIDLRHFPDYELHTLQLITKKNLNATLIEPWLRRKNGLRHAVSAKLLLVVYLAECCNESPRMIRQMSHDRFSITATVLRGLMGLLYGLFLKVRYGLV